MVPLVGGVRAELETLALGEVGQAVAADGSVQIRTTALSYFSRLTDAATFRGLARGELYRRGTAAATVVCAVQDGAEWQQPFVDHHRPDAVRILDFPHALEHLGTAGRAFFGAGTAAFSEWLGVQAHTFKHGDPTVVLSALRALDLMAAANPAGPATPPPLPTTSAPAAASPRPAPPPPAPDTPPRIIDGRPAADHPWRKPFLRSRQRQPLPALT